MNEAREQVRREVKQAYIFLRKKNHTIPSETLQFMLDASLEKLNSLREDSMQEIRIKYFHKDLPKLEKISKGDWIDLRAAETVEIQAGGFRLIPLGVAMELPKGYEAHIAPRSSSYKHFRTLQTNSVGVVDNSYKGDNDQWLYPVYATEDTIINKGDRICQFRIMEKMPEIQFTEVTSLDNEDRGGHGSTGKQ